MISHRYQENDSGCCVENKGKRGSCVVQSVECPTLDLDSGHGLMVREFLHPSSAHMCALLLSQNKEERGTEGKRGVEKNL